MNMPIDVPPPSSCNIDLYRSIHFSIQMSGVHVCMRLYVIFIFTADSKAVAKSHLSFP